MMAENTSFTHGININTLDRVSRGHRRIEEEEASFEVKGLKLYYGEKQALQGIDMVIPRKCVTAFIGPSGCGKSTLLRCFNRMNDLVDGCRVEGSIELHGQDIYDKTVDVANLRRRVGMVFQKPNPFPKSIYENVAYGPPHAGRARPPHRAGGGS